MFVGGKNNKTQQIRCWKIKRIRIQCRLISKISNSVGRNDNFLVKARKLSILSTSLEIFDKRQHYVRILYLHFTKTYFASRLLQALLRLNWVIFDSFSLGHDPSLCVVSTGNHNDSNMDYTQYFVACSFFYFYLDPCVLFSPFSSIFYSSSFVSSFSSFLLF